ncbi:hypothetical protein Bbelb_386250 [Branchiostoma belcheri]|nr:hypothetical protein Bbelb_386250 [Branchiostoma belcheri]
MEGNDRQQANKDNITRPTNLENTTSSANVPAAIRRRLFESRWFTLLAGTVLGICITHLFVVPDHAAPYAPKSEGGLRDRNIPAWKARYGVGCELVICGRDLVVSKVICGWELVGS